MPKRSITLRLIFAQLCVLAAAFIAAGPRDAMAFGFGRGFGGPMVMRPMGPSPWLRRLPPPPRRGGPIIGGERGPEPGPGRRRPPIIGGGGGIIGGGAAAAAPSGGRGGNNNSNAVAQNNLPYIADEIITAFAAGTPPAAITQFAGRYNLTQVETQNFTLIGTSLYRWRIGNGRSVSSIVQALGSENIVASVQPNNIVVAQNDASKPADVQGASQQQGDSSQYVLTELQAAQAHQLATGKNVVIAVIDSEIDANHPDLGGTIVNSYDALDAKAAPHIHGTSMAGAIASHGKLLGIAPGVSLLAIHALDGDGALATGQSFAIYKAVQWASDNGARIINMSFSGPSDPLLVRILAAAYHKGIVLIAAAGNGGPQAEPAYPAADPDVIAVTATDDKDHLFPMANRGRYIAVAAPGVDIISLAPGGAYQLSSGTSIAAAHVSGIAALLLERKPTMTPADVRSTLVATARQIGPPTPDSAFGAGLANAWRAITWLDHAPPASAAQAKQ